MQHARAYASVHGAFCTCAEEQEYRERVRKQKQMIYDQYLWRKLLLQDFAHHVDFMNSPAWEASYRAKLERCAGALAAAEWPLAAGEGSLLLEKSRADSWAQGLSSESTFQQLSAFMHAHHLLACQKTAPEQRYAATDTACLSSVNIEQGHAARLGPGCSRAS
jgi:hypothetical protein